jgi:peroxiredoxin Q/BCP
MLKPGDKAPEFRVKADDDKDIALSDFRGKRVLLFFFPKANTSG